MEKEYNSPFIKKDDYNNVIANPVLWDEACPTRRAIYNRLLRRPKNKLLVMTWELCK